MAIHVRRREFIAALGGAVLTWPLAARAQQGQRIRRIGMLWITAEADRQSTTNRVAFTRQLYQLGWRLGDNVRVDNRWAANDVSRLEQAHRSGPPLFSVNCPVYMALAMLCGMCLQC
jgi:putative ABC transport system substrate-binding protein